MMGSALGKQYRSFLKADYFLINYIIILQNLLRITPLTLCSARMKYQYITKNGGESKTSKIQAQVE